MLKALIKTRLMALLSYFVKGSKKKQRSFILKLGIGALAVYVIGCFLLLFGMFFSQICVPYHSAGIDWLYFGMAGIMSAGLMFIGSIFTTQTQLFDAKDNELLLAMPIPPKYILGSRMIMLLIMNLILELFVIGPAFIIYCINVPIGVGGILCFIFIFLALSLLILAISCLIGWVLAKISQRVRNKSLITTVASVVFIGAYFFFYTKINEYIQMLILNGTAIAKSLYGAALPVYWLGSAISDANIVNLFMFILCAVIPFAVVYAILSANFIRTATMKHGFAKIKYTEKSLKVGSVKTALLKKELKRFSSSAVYITNSALGDIFVVLGAIFILVKRDVVDQLLVEAPELFAFIAPASVLAMCFLASSNMVSAPSISLEGKNLWIAQSLPVNPIDILMSKVMLHNVVCLPPTMLGGIIIAIALRLSLAMCLLMLISIAAVTVFSALAGVAVNLKFPKLDWISETVPIKQSASTIISMLLGAAVVTIPGVLYFVLLGETMSAELFIGIFILFVCLLCALLYSWLKKKGSVLFQTLV